MEGPFDILGLGFADFETLARARLAKGAGLAGKVYARAFAQGRLELGGLGLSESALEGWRENFRVGLLGIARTAEEEGEFGATVKAAMVCPDGAEIECVLVPMPPRPDGRKRASICVSSQVGCRMGCAFCETGRGGLVRNLLASEIVSQIVTARALLGWEPGTVVFMGMGEPLDNLGEVAKALHVLVDGRGLGLGWDKLTVCTSGSVEGIARLRELGHPRLNLSLSLNAADDDTRSRLMPANRAAGLGSLAAALRAYPRRRNFALALNWCLLPGINDGPGDARAAAAFAASVGRSLVNLIPYNPGSHPIAPAPTEAEVEAFAALLAARGLLVKRRATKGGRIMAGCGQLGGRRGEERAPE